MTAGREAAPSRQETKRMTEPGLGRWEAKIRIVPNEPVAPRRPLTAARQPLRQDTGHLAAGRQSADRVHMGAKRHGRPYVSDKQRGSARPLPAL